MSSFTKASPLEAVPPDYKLYRNTIEFEYRVGNEQSGKVIKIPKGYITDGASIPKWAWSIIGGPVGKYAPAAIVHDYIIEFELYPRKKADKIFLEAMKVLKVPFWKRRIMYRAVRINSGWRKLLNWYKETYRYDEDTDDTVH